MGTECESMLHLAAEAFQANNFELAADIYECQLAFAGDPGSRLELMVKRADALAFGGKVAEAFEVYRQASEIDKLKPAHLSNLVGYLSDSIRRQDRGGSHGSRWRTGCGSGSGFEDFSCGICLSFLFEPVTLPCGHCFCKKCLERERKEKEQPVVCKECRDSSRLADLQTYRVNVVLSSLLAKWFPRFQQAGRLRREGNGLYAERKMEAALEKYNQAILTAPTDHILFSNRSQIHSSLKHHDWALRDAETSCRLMPFWAKGHVRKAQALVSLGRTDDALKEYLICLSLEPDCRLAKAEAHKPFKEDLRELRIPEDFITDFSSVVFGNRRAALEAASSQNDPHLPTLEEFKWRVDVSISTSSLARALQPSVLMQLKLSDGSFQRFEVPVSKFQELRYNVALILKEMNNLEKRSILKIQD